MKKYILFFGSVIMLKTSFGQTEFMEQFKSFIGNWKIKSNTNFNSYECWNFENDSTFIGKSYIISNTNDTSFLESITLTKINHDIFYLPIVKDENVNKPIPFKLTSHKNSIFIFENPEHDFPQKIIYNLSSYNMLLASIEGNLNGVFTKRNFEMKRVL